jgi:serine/threonine protein kinase
MLDLLSNRSTPLADVMAKFMDVLHAVAYLHGHLRVAHLDIKLENILIDQRGRAVLGDFGVASVCGVPDEAEGLAAYNAKFEALLSAELKANPAIDAATLEKEKQTWLAGFPLLYSEACNAVCASHRAFTASNDAVREAIEGIPRPAVPASHFFDPSTRERWTPELVDSIVVKPAFADSIVGFVPPQELSLKGTKLLSAFHAHVRATAPRNAQLDFARAHAAVLAPQADPWHFAHAASDSAALSQLHRARCGTCSYMCPRMVGKLPPPVNRKRRRSNTAPPPPKPEPAPEPAPEPTLLFAADAYSLGITLFTILARNRPYGNPLVDVDRYSTLVNEGLRGYLQVFRTNCVIPEACIPILERMLAADPARRPSVRECIAALAPVEFDTKWVKSPTG